ncbi:MAG: hypothetical protein FWE05_11875 [Defluviitaleaceae bacterium]|nr:hypothetical protein [Defluviitaleaceae bacterium]
MSLSIHKFTGSFSEIDTCINCGENPACVECETVLDYCIHCGETIKTPEVHLVFTVDRYNGMNNSPQDTVNLMIDGQMYAAAHINLLEEDKSADVAHLHIYVSPNEATLVNAQIIADFAKWLRYDWKTSNKCVVDFPTIVRLMGCITHTNRPLLQQLEWFVALPNACDITVEHLAYGFTHKTV